MEYEFSDDTIEMLYETLSNIELAITRLQERTNQVHSADDFRLSPWGMEKLDAACMVLIAIGESVKTLDKLTDKETPSNISFHRMERCYGGERCYCASLFRS